MSTPSFQWLLLARRHQPSQRGITLIELLVAIVIIGIISSVAYPQYTSFVKKGRRSAAQSEMMQVANALQQYLMIRRSYTTSFTDLGSGFSTAVTADYTCAITDPAVNTSRAGLSFLITCTPKSGGYMSGDVTLTLNSEGVRSPADKW